MTMTAIEAYADAVVAFVDSLVAKGSDAALGVSLRIDVNNYNDDADEEPLPVGGCLHLVCHAPNNYIGVYAALTERPLWPADGYHWTCVGCHDSCWRDSVRRAFVETYGKVVAHAEKAFEWPVSKLSVNMHLDEVKLAPGGSLIGAHVANRQPRDFDVDALLEQMPR